MTTIVPSRSTTLIRSVEQSTIWRWSSWLRCKAEWGRKNSSASVAKWANRSGGAGSPAAIVRPCSCARPSTPTTLSPIRSGAAKTALISTVRESAQPP